MDTLPLLAIHFTITWVSDTLMNVTPVVQTIIDILPKTSELEVQIGPAN